MSPRRRDDEPDLPPAAGPATGAVEIGHDRPARPGQFRRLPCAKATGRQGLQIRHPFMAAAAAGHAQLVFQRDQAADRHQ